MAKTFQLAESFNDGNKYMEFHKDENRNDKRPLRFGKAKAKALLQALRDSHEEVIALLESYVGAS